jgi:hypothetical protein
MENKKTKTNMSAAHHKAQHDQGPGGEGARHKRSEKRAHHVDDSALEDQLGGAWNYPGIKLKIQKIENLKK